MKDPVKFTSLVVDETAHKQIVPNGWTRTKWNNHVLKETVKVRQDLINDGHKNIPPLKDLVSNAYKILSVIEELKNPFLKGIK